jgi:predicted signal transduction protein with EAL and GGDEF domain
VERDSDICCRYGGEEFAVILPMTDIHKAASIAERLKIELAEPIPGGRMVTVSIGVASCGKLTKTYRDLVEKADAALYQAKGNGKNRVVVAPGERYRVLKKTGSPPHRIRKDVSKTPNSLSTPLHHDALPETI